MRMQKLTPKIAKIKEKYADDKDTQQKEIMQLYKQAGATPILGCLPMFLQMPIWIALWSSLNAAIALRHENFLPFWLTDLASPDALFSWSTPINIPLISNLAGPITSFNLLPILLCIAMYLQTKINPSMAAAAGGGGASSDQAKQQAKMMKYFMPAFLLLIFYNAPSGLTLYIMTSTFAGVAEQQIIRRHIAKREEADEQAETKVLAPGKRSRNSRPKKPKGPFFMKKG
jgi:YidC/Oxa1 family membrane protein insertase